MILVLVPASVVQLTESAADAYRLSQPRYLAVDLANLYTRLRLRKLACSEYAIKCKRDGLHIIHEMRVACDLSSRD